MVLPLKYIGPEKPLDPEINSQFLKTTPGPWHSFCYGPQGWYFEINAVSPYPAELTENELYRCIECSVKAGEDVNTPAAVCSKCQGNSCAVCGWCPEQAYHG